MCIRDRSIGLGQFCHAIRRNLNMLYIIENNGVYGLTTVSYTHLAHALAGAKRWAHAHPGRSILVGLSGRGDKDMSTLQRTLIDVADAPSREPLR